MSAQLPKIVSENHLHLCVLVQVFYNRVVENYFTLTNNRYLLYNIHSTLGMLVSCSSKSLLMILYNQFKK